MIEKTYFHGLDMLRAGLMIMGVFWHAVSVMSPASHFVYDSSIHESYPLYIAIFPSHIFRMETFFLVSGFLAVMIRLRKGRRAFFEARLKRVVIPLVLGCFGVNLLLQIFGAQFMGYQWANFDSWRWVMHGWFLITLFICALIDIAIPERVYQFGNYSLILMIFIAIFGYIGINYVRHNYWNFSNTLIINTFNYFILNTLQYYPFYFCGGLLFAHHDKLTHITRKHLMIISLVTLTVFLVDYTHNMHWIDIYQVLPKWHGITFRTIQTMAASGTAFLLFWLFYHSRYVSGSIVRYLINSAIVIYLLHHPLIIILGWGLDTPALSNGAYYSLLVGITLILCYTFYEIIRRVAWLRFAFGLK